MCSCDEGEPAKVSRHERRKARKQHRCYDCDRAIPIGAHYSRSVMLYESTWDSMAICQRCDDLRHAWYDVDGCWLMLGNLRDELRGCIDGPEVSRLLLAALRKRRRERALKEAA